MKDVQEATPKERRRLPMITDVQEAMPEERKPQAADGVEKPRRLSMKKDPIPAGSAMSGAASVAPRRRRVRVRIDPSDEEGTRGD